MPICFVDIGGLRMTEYDIHNWEKWTLQRKTGHIYIYTYIACNLHVTCMWLACDLHATSSPHPSYSAYEQHNPSQWPPFLHPPSKRSSTEEALDVPSLPSCETPANEDSLAWTTSQLALWGRESQQYLAYTCMCGVCWEGLFESHGWGTCYSNFEICLPVAMGHGAEEDQSQHFSSSQSHCSNHMLLKPIPIGTNKQVTNHYIHTYSLAHYAIYIYSGTSI